MVLSSWLVKKLEKSVFTQEYQLLLSLLNEARVQAGFSQEELAKRVPHSQKFISRCETGERRIDVIELRALCRALGVSFVEFIERLETKLNELEK